MQACTQHSTTTWQTLAAQLVASISLHLLQHGEIVLTVQAPLQMQNHCCAPSLYIKVLEVDGRGRLLFFARHDIAMGQVQRPFTAFVCG